jgi:hypothetical protein
LTLTADKRLQILGQYDAHSNYDNVTNWVKPKNVKNVWFEDIANLARNSTVAALAFDPDTDNTLGTTDVYFASSINEWGFDKYCRITSPVFTASKTCTTYSELSADIIQKQNDVFASSKGIDDVANKYLIYTQYANVYSVKDFSKETSGKTLLDSATEINNALTSSTILY